MQVQNIQNNSQALYTFYKQKYQNAQIQYSTNTNEPPQKLQNITISLKPVKRNLKNSYIISKNASRSKLQNSKMQLNEQKQKIRCRTQVLVNHKNKNMSSVQSQLSTDKKQKYQVNKIQHVFQTEVSKIQQRAKAKFYSRTYEQVMLLAKCLPLKKTQKFKSKTIPYQPYGLLKKKSIDQKRIKAKSTLSKQHNQNLVPDNKIVVEWKSMTRQNSTILQIIKNEQKNNEEVFHKIHEEKQNTKVFSSKSLKLAPIQRTKSILFRLKMNKKTQKPEKKNNSLQKLFLINDVSFIHKTSSHNKTMQLKPTQYKQKQKQK